MDRQRTQEQNERRAAYLRGKIERAQGELDSLGQPSARPPTGPNILIGVPCFGGMLHWRAVATLTDLGAVLSRAGIRFRVQFVSDSLITRARNFLASIAAFHADGGHPYTHLFFQDADISFQAEDVLKMLSADKAIVALLYSLKTMNWSRVADAARRGCPPEQLPEFGGFPALNSDKPFPVDALAEVRAAATGAMLVKVEVLKALADAHPERRYKPNLRDFQPRLDWHWDFFKVGICPEANVYLSEDFQFCADAKRIGYQTFVLPSARTVHSGSADYVLNMPAIASLGSAPPVESSKPLA